MRSGSEGGRLSGLSGSFRNNKPFVVVALVVSLISVGCFLQTERTDYVKNDQGWQYPIYDRRWQTTLSDTTQKVKIVLILPEKLDVWQKGSVVARDFDESEYDRVRLEFWASGQSTGAYSLSVKLNGREVKRYPQGIRGNAQWHSIPLEGLMREAIRDVGEAEVIFSLSGAPKPETDYVTFHGDAAVASRNSSLFDGVDWTRDDLSEQPGDQQGEFYVRLAYAKSLFTEPSLTSERVVILLLYLAAICLLVLFRRSINSFRASMALSALKSTFKAYREIIVLLALVFVLALVLRSYFVARHPQPELIKDAALYDTQARNVVSGYGLAAKPPQLYPMFFGYTLLLAGVYSVLGHDLQAVHLFQAVLGSLTCVLVFLIAYRSFDKDKHLSLIAGLLACCFPPFIEYTGRLLTETLATFALALFIYLFIAATRATRNQLFILSGLAFGLAVISRDLFFYFLVFVLTILVVTFWRNKGKVIRFTVLFLLGVILICSPLLARNALVFSPGRAFGTMVRLSFSQILVLAADQNTVPAESKVADDNSEEGQETAVGTEDALPTEVSSVKNDLIRGWVRYPWGYVERWLFKIDEFWYSAANWRDAAIFGIPLKYLLVFRRLIVFMAMLGVIVSLPRWKEHLLLYSLIVYPSVVHAIFLPFPRYTIPWMPYVCIFAVRGIATIILVFRSGGKYVALSLIAWATAFAMTMNVDKQSLLKLFGPLITYAQLSVIRPYRLVIELCLIALICFLLINNRRRIPNAIISTSAILLALGYVSLRGQTLPLSPHKEDVSSVLTDVDHYVGHLIDLPRWTRGYDRYFLKIKLDGAWIEPPQKKYGVRVFANGEMIKEYPIANEVIHGWERIPLDKRIIEDQKKLYVSLQVFGAPDVFENYLAVFVRKGQQYGLSVFTDSTRYLSIDRDEKQNGTFLIGLEMRGKGPSYRDVDLWLGSRLSQADKLSLLGDESGVWYNLGEKIRLIGYEVSGTARPGEALRPRLYWQAQAPMDEDYTVFVQLFDGRGDLRAQHDCQPQRGDYPTSLWQRGEVIWDVHRIALPSDLAAGTYRLVAGMYLLESVGRLPVFDGTGRRVPDDLIPLGEIQVVGF